MLSSVMQLGVMGGQPRGSNPDQPLRTRAVPPDCPIVPARDEHSWPDSATKLSRWPWKVTRTRIMSTQQMVETRVSDAGQQPRVTLSIWDPSDCRP